MKSFEKRMEERVAAKGFFNSSLTNAYEYRVKCNPEEQCYGDVNMHYAIDGIKTLYKMAEEVREEMREERENAKYKCPYCGFIPDKEIWDDYCRDGREIIYCACREGFLTKYFGEWCWAKVGKEI